MSSLYSFGIGIGTKNRRGEWLEVFYPTPLLNPPKELVSVITSSLGANSGDIEPTTDQLSALHSALNHNGYSELASSIKALIESSRPVSATLLTADIPPTSVPQGYLKLHLLSHRLVKPHETELAGIFGVLKNVAWTSAGAIDVEELPDRLLQARVDGQPLTVDSVDKFLEEIGIRFLTNVKQQHTRKSSVCPLPVRGGDGGEVAEFDKLLLVLATGTELGQVRASESEHTRTASSPASGAPRCACS